MNAPHAPGGVEAAAQQAGADAQLTVDAQQPWLGLASFTEETRAYFYGREEEVAELARRVQRKPLTILFGQSGLGKTSILRAGIVPRLRPEGYCPVYVRIDYSPDTPPPSEQIKQAIFRATESSGQWTRPGVAVEGESLWEFLHHRDDMLVDAQGKPVIPLLIFDQFEEIFTLAQADDAGRRRAQEFAEDLADLVENRLPKALEARLDRDDTIADRFDFGRADYRILIALREDYLAHLEGLKGVMPSITQNRMRLARMNGTQALAAVMRPGGRLVTQEVAEAIVRFTAGGSELRNAEVEPSLLSLICRELNNARLAQGRAEISADVLAGSHETILAEFYERALADQPPAVRKVIEEQLLTESGFRESLAEERVLKAFAEAGAMPGALATLVNRRLLRIEERLDVRRVELTHDVLTGVVKASRQVRLEREALEEAERKLAAQREREAATRRALVRARQIAAGCAVLALIAVGAGIFGVVGMHRAKEAEARAQKAHELADTARGESERLIVYLLDDFYRELEPVGQLNVVRELAKRALDYYDGLPAELRGPETRRNQALAQVRYGAVLRYQGRAADSIKVLDTAIPTLEDLRKQGDTSEATTIGLALGLVAKARASQALDGVPFAARAVEVLGPVPTMPSASRELQRTYAAAQTQLGFNQQRAARNPEAIAALQAARDAYKRIDGLTQDADAMANYAITTAWLMDAYATSGRPDEALQVGDDARKVATTLLERQPANMLALRARALLSSNSARAAEQKLQQGRALAAADAAAADWFLLSRLDPSNVITVTNFGVGRNLATQALFALGRPAAAAAKSLEGVGLIEATAPRAANVMGHLSVRYYSAAIAEAELGRLDAAERLMARAMEANQKYLQMEPPTSFEHRLWTAANGLLEMEYAIATGDVERARAKAGGIRPALLKVDTGGARGREAFRASMLRRLHVALGNGALMVNDPQEAERQFRLALEANRDFPPETLSDERDLAYDTSNWALALARTGRAEEARAPAAKALAVERRVAAMKTDDQMHKASLALALVASAWANPSQAKALLAEAQAQYDSLPAEARAMHSVRATGNQIADAKRALR